MALDTIARNLAAVALKNGGGTTDYNMLDNKPKFNTTETGSLSTNSSETIANIIKLHKISKTGSYNDLINKPDVYLKSETMSTSEIQSLVVGMFKYKGSVQTYADLPSTGNNDNDVYIVLTASAEARDGEYFAWTNNAWHSLGVNVIDLSDYYNKSEVDSLVSTKASTSYVDTAVAGVTKSSLGLGNVDNTSDANKPVSNPQQNALNNKQDTLVSATNIKTINSVSILGSGNLGIDKAAVGLGAADNTADIDKPISTATQTALDTKVNKGGLGNFNVKISKSGLNQSISSGSVYNLLSTVVFPTDILSITNITSDKFNLSSGIIKMPTMTDDTRLLTTYWFEVRLYGTLNTLSSSREFSVEVRRSDDSIVSSRSIVKVDNDNLSSKAVGFISFASNNTDPYIANGLKFVINNDSDTTMNITGFDIVINGLNV